jgi:hypothetical protein
MQFFTVYDNAVECLNTTDELTALRMLRKLCEKYKVTWAVVDTKEMQ